MTTPDSNHRPAEITDVVTQSVVTPINSQVTIDRSLLQTVLTYNDPNLLRIGLKTITDAELTTEEFKALYGESLHYNVIYTNRALIASRNVRKDILNNHKDTLTSLAVKQDQYTQDLYNRIKLKYAQHEQILHSASDIVFQRALRMFGEIFQDIKNCPCGCEWNDKLSNGVSSRMQQILTTSERELIFNAFYDGSNEEYWRASRNYVPTNKDNHPFARKCPGDKFNLIIVFLETVDLSYDRV